METEIIELWHVRPDWQLPCTYEYGYEASRLQAYLGTAVSIHVPAGLELLISRLLASRGPQSQSRPR